MDRLGDVLRARIPRALSGQTCLFNHNKTTRRRDAAVTISNLLLSLPEPVFQFPDLRVQALRKMAAEPGKVFPDQRNLGMPALQIHVEQLGDVRWRKVKSFSIQISGLGKPANRCFYGVHFAVAALENPFQDPAVLAVSRPQEFAI